MYVKPSFDQTNPPEVCEIFSKPSPEVTSQFIRILLECALQEYGFLRTGQPADAP